MGIGECGDISSQQDYTVVYDIVLQFTRVTDASTHNT